MPCVALVFLKLAANADELSTGKRRICFLHSAELVSTRLYEQLVMGCSSWADCHLGHGDRDPPETQYMSAVVYTRSGNRYF